MNSHNTLFSFFHCKQTLVINREVLINWQYSIPFKMLKNSKPLVNCTSCDTRQLVRIKIPVLLVKERSLDSKLGKSNYNKCSIKCIRYSAKRSAGKAGTELTGLHDKPHSARQS